MAITYGFYNAVNHDRLYDAIEVSRIFDGIVKDGVLAHIGDCFLPRVVSGMTVNIGTGRCWFNHSWLLNDAIEPIKFDQSELLLDRYDMVVIETDSSVGTRANAIKIIKGTPSSTPIKPEYERGEYLNQYPICYVYIHADSTEIKQADIEYVVGTEACPYVTGLLEIVTVDQILAQWSAQWHDYITTYQEQLTSWTTQQQQDFLAWSALQESTFASWVSDFETAAEDWSDEKQKEFTNWFENLVYVLDGDVAGHLQNEIDEIKAAGLAGSILNIETTAVSLRGKTVTVQGANKSATGTFDNNGKATITSFIDVGPITITSTDGTETARTTGNLPYFSQYNFPLEFWRAVLHITTNDESLIGQTVQVYDSNETLAGSAVFPIGMEVTIAVTTPDTYKIICSEYEQEILINQEQTYEIDIQGHSGEFDYEEWLRLASLNPSDYSSLDDVLADEVAIRKLMTIHASVDYLAEQTLE